jgi:hypothetical protein
MAGLDPAYWESRTAEGMSKYAGKTGQMEQNVISGLTAIGLTPGPQFRARLSAGLQRAPERMRARVSGKGAIWAANTRAGIQR